MVPPEELEKSQPTTLPADFSEWDSGDSAGGQSANVSGYDGFSGVGVAPKPVSKSVTARVAVLPAAERLPNAGARKQDAAYADAEQAYQRPVQPPAQPRRAAAAAPKRPAEGKGKGKGTLIFATAGAAVLLGGLGFAYFRHQPKTAAPNTTTVVMQPATTTAPMAMTTASASKPSASSAAAANEAATQSATPQARPLRAESEAMDHQLNAPSRISRDLKALSGKDVPATASFNAASLEGLGTAGGNVFAGQSGPKVKVASGKPVAISAGVAVGLLIQKTPPVYPSLARTARVSGTVVIQATITKNGTVGKVSVVNGPKMLQDAALEAVKTWRYRPYLLDGEPVEAETTVSVNFTM
jgi:protein TonB